MDSGLRGPAGHGGAGQTGCWAGRAAPAGGGSGLLGGER